MTSNRPTRLRLLFILGACAAAGCSGSSEPGAGPDAAPGGDGDLPILDRFVPLAEALEAERQALGAPGVAALVIEDGVVTFAHGFGKKGVDSDEPVTSSTLFRIGSVTKMLTAAVLLQSVAAGEIALDDPITRVLPEFSLAGDASWAPSIQVEHLLTHSSGLLDYAELDAAADLQDDGALDRFLTQDLPQGFEEITYLMAPSGRMFNYSNPNFYLAGLLAERLGGQSYRDAMRERLFSPLGMDRTFFLSDEVLADGDFASGAIAGPGGQQTAVAPDAYDNPWGRPAGYAFSSVHDLARFVGFLQEGDDAVLPADQRLAMQSPQIDTEELLDLIHYGYGLQIQEGFLLADGFYPVRLVAHGGDITGFAADLVSVPESRFAFIVLANGNGAHFRDSVEVALDIAADLPAPIDPPDLGIDPASFARYAGTYQEDFGIAGTLIIEASDTGVTISMPMLDEAGISYQAELEPVSPGNFIMRGSDFALPITFILSDDSGDAEYLRTRFFVAHREAPGDERRTHRSDASRLLRQLRHATPAAPLIWRPAR
jgi:CubicO group peptidase (beta-lactamase class C family)